MLNIPAHDEEAAFSAPAALDDKPVNIPMGKTVQIPLPGISLRDYFAGIALGAIINDPKMGAYADSRIAQGAYEFADAMLIERRAKS